MKDIEKEIEEVLNKLVQDPEFRKYPHSYNPNVIAQAKSRLDKLYRQLYLGHLTCMCMDCGKSFKVIKQSKHMKECLKDHWIKPTKGEK